MKLLKRRDHMTLAPRAERLNRTRTREAAPAACNHPKVSAAERSSSRARSSTFRAVLLYRFSSKARAARCTGMRQHESERRPADG